MLCCTAQMSTFHDDQPLFKSASNANFQNIQMIVSLTDILSFCNSVSFSLAFLVVLGVVVMAVACKIHRREKRSPVSADALINGYVYR